MPTSNENATDSDLWTLVRQGSAEAFEVLLRRYQSLVCAVAYSACGELSQSEDVAQETFWAAWRGRESLDQPDRLGSWLCGIARNLGKNARRRASRPVESAASLDDVAERSTDAPGPAEQATFARRGIDRLEYARTDSRHVSRAVDPFLSRESIGGPGRVRT